jgi:formamidopyrimidine-DNA glycosylase
VLLSIDGVRPEDCELPELPEVETMCRGLRPIVGKKICAVSVPPCHYRPISMRPNIAEIDARLTGSKVTDIVRLGKRVVIQSKSESLVFQPKMTGMVTLEQPPDIDHVRLMMTLAGGVQVLFWDRRGLGTVELLQTNELYERIVEGRLGPDALVITPEEFAQRLRTTRRPIKVALLDQKLVAGIGNLYASEMLFAAKINPRKPASRVSVARLLKLHTWMLHILNVAIENEGSTLSDGTYRNALSNPGNYQNMHRVYDKSGQLCRECQSEFIRRIVQSQRSTFYCPQCQAN